jgi:hypothetical protein
VIKFTAHIEQNKLIQVAFVEYLTQTNGRLCATANARQNATRQNKQIRAAIGISRDEQLANQATHPKRNAMRQIYLFAQIKLG